MTNESNVATYKLREIHQLRSDVLSRISQISNQPGEYQGALDSMDETTFVTHADYRALEERHQALLNAIAKGHVLADRTNKIDRPKVIGMAILDAMKDWA